ncbi:type II 3-dehydroquinate dehydratase [Francisellaceae bacterium]|nr:type II 3-dehydroquinate dehydratase [Francisellaceae bacterium]MDA7742087.1 type II 3-dehydroquinate dehydratase [Francisellaceae bacterium]
MANILVLHGPNLNMLGVREPEKYGKNSLAQINDTLEVTATQEKVTLACKQSNNESDLIGIIHQAYKDNVNFIIFNPAAFTHTSIALRDALLATNIKFIEVHLSNIYAREAFRHTSYFSDIAYGTISGFGAESYKMALTQAIHYCQDNF